MKTNPSRALFALLLAAVPAALLAQPAVVIRAWPRGPAAAARVMIVKYGTPARFGKHALVWEDMGPWKRTVVYSNAWPMFVGATDKDFLEQTIARPVPPSKIPALTLFDRRLRIDEERGELSSRSESEEANFLALNLAEELISGRRTVSDAKGFYAKTLALSQAGKSSPYLEGLMYAPH